MKTTLHILFWIIISVLLTLIFKSYFSNISESFYFVSMLMPVVIGTCYFFNLYLIPRFLYTKKYVKFVLYTFYMLVFSLYFEMIVIMLSLVFLAQYSYDNMSPVSSDIFVLALVLYFIVILYSFNSVLKNSLQKENVISNLNNEKRKNETISMTFRSKRKFKTVEFEKISYIESLSDYVKIHLIDETSFTTKDKISRLEDVLPNEFIRIHRSFIVNKTKLSSFNKVEVFIGKTPIPISRSYRDIVAQKLLDK